MIQSRTEVGSGDDICVRVCVCVVGGRKGGDSYTCVVCPIGRNVACLHDQIDIISMDVFHPIFHNSHCLRDFFPGVSQEH